MSGSPMIALSMTRGDDESFDVVVKDRDGVVVDITDMDLRFTAKRRITDADDDAVMTKTIGAGITVISAIGGTARIDIDAEDTDDLTGTLPLEWDLQGTDELGKVRTLASGRLRVGLDVSRTGP